MRAKIEIDLIRQGEYEAKPWDFGMIKGLRAFVAYLRGEGYPVNFVLHLQSGEEVAPDKTADTSQ